MSAGAGARLVGLDWGTTSLRAFLIGADGAVLMLAETPGVPLDLPVRVRLTEGCDKQLSTCRDRFANAVNFRGEAHLPGNDLMTRYPGG